MTIINQIKNDGDYSNLQIRSFVTDLEVLRSENKYSETIAFAKTYTSYKEKQSELTDRYFGGISNDPRTLKIIQDLFDLFTFLDQTIQ